MKFDYNSHLDFMERCSFVANEIQKEYPLISLKEAVRAASFTIPLDDKVTNDIKFDRYYFILRTIGRGHDEFSHVFNDLYDLYVDGFEKVEYNDLMLKIIDYAAGDDISFPDLVEY